MNSFLPSDELLSAYLDGEATAQEREVVERALRENPVVRQSLEELRRLQAELCGLPRLRLGLATRDPLSGVSRVVRSDSPTTQPAKNGETDEGIAEARDGRQPSAGGTTTKFSDHLDREEGWGFDRSSSRNKLDSLADAP